MVIGNGGTLNWANAASKGLKASDLDDSLKTKSQGSGTCVPEPNSPPYSLNPSGFVTNLQAPLYPETLHLDRVLLGL